MNVVVQRDGDIKLEPSRTMYYFEGVIDSPEDPNRDIMLCRECAAAHHEYWNEMWADYYSGLLWVDDKILFIRKFREMGKEQQMQTITVMRNNSEEKVGLLDTQVANLEKLATFLETQCDPIHFDMSDFFLDGKGVFYFPYQISKKDYIECGTVACAAGYGPAAGIEPKSKESWFTYIINNFTGGVDEVYFWCFSNDWAYVDNTPLGAAKRIKYMLKHKHIPIDMDTFTIHYINDFLQPYVSLYNGQIFYINVEMKEFMEAYNND